MVHDKLNKEVEKLQDWTNNNELQKFNKAIMVLTFFIGLGEMSTIAKDYLSVENQDMYLKLTFIGFLVLIIFMIWIFQIHEKRLTNSQNQSFENMKKLIDSIPK